MSVSILIVDDEPDVADWFRQRFRRETWTGAYVLHFATSGEDEVGEKSLSRREQGTAPRNVSWNYKVVPSRELRPAQSCAPSCCAMGNSAPIPNVKRAIADISV
jgi:CheY-like chemotaxis protein